MSKSIISDCCAREVVKGTKHDPHPLGPREYNGRGIFYTIDVCSCCGMECDTAEVFVCECCGIVSDRESTVCSQCESVAV